MDKIKTMSINWTCKIFEDLSSTELYAIMHLRNEVFVVEQNCVYQDADFKDLHAHHLTAWDDKKLVAYCRLLPAGIAFEKCSIGRVITHPDYRKLGLGKQLMTLAIENIQQIFKENCIIIGAQLYLKNFYESLGFKQISETYLEDGIPHIEMQRGTA